MLPESPQSGTSSHYSGQYGTRTPMYNSSDYMTPSPAISPLTPGGEFSPRTPGSPMDPGMSSYSGDISHQSCGTSLKLGSSRIPSPRAGLIPSPSAGLIPSLDNNVYLCALRSLKSLRHLIKYSYFEIESWKPSSSWLVPLRQVYLLFRDFLLSSSWSLPSVIVHVSSISQVSKIAKIPAEDTNL